MATAQDIIDSALRLLGVLASGETPTQLERNDGLVTLNQLLASWNAQGLPIPGITDEGFSLSGLYGYTIGTGATINTIRPLRLIAASCTRNSVAKPATVLYSAQEWVAASKDRSAQGAYAEVVYYNPAYPMGTINIWPAVTSPSFITLYSLKPLTAFGSLGATVTLPDGYERALRFELAGELANEYGRPLGENLARMIADAKTSIIGLNQANLGHPGAGSPPVSAPATEAVAP